MKIPDSSRSHVVSLTRLLEWRLRWQKRRRRVVFTNGVFDILHKGHLALLEKARSLGDVLVVGINTDSSVKRTKGPSRPINTQNDRAQIVAALRMVDAVCLFSDDTPLNLITRLRPDVLVKGADYKESEIVGAQEVRSWGGEVKRVALVKGRSVTQLIDRIEQ